jgi:transcriptional regulator with XRE-family HTH domain
MTRKVKVHPYKLALIRKDRNLTQVELANKLNISPQKFRNIEQGQQIEVHENTLRELAKELKCSPYQIIWHEDDVFIDSFFSIIKEQRKMLEDFYSSCFEKRWEFDKDIKAPSSFKLEYFTSKSREFFRLKFDKFVSDIDSLEKDKSIKKRLGEI